MFTSKSAQPFKFAAEPDEEPDDEPGDEPDDDWEGPLPLQAENIKDKRRIETAHDSLLMSFLFLTQ
ncbi:MAG: hypothetical protein HY098_05290 [Nitrospinae bacterium]|nr:hypothetical protein [Nitrospinota bacterium]